MLMARSKCLVDFERKGKKKVNVGVSEKHTGIRKFTQKAQVTFGGVGDRQHL